MSLLLQRAFTLIELITVVAIVGIFAAIAGPSFRTMLLNGRLASEANDLVADVAYARSESARRGKRIALCISTNGTSCSTGNSWQNGRVIFADESNSGTAGTVDSGEEILRGSPAVSSSVITIAASGFTNASGTATTNYIQYRPNGALNSTSATGSFKICDDRTGNFGRKIEISNTGRVAVTSTIEPCP